MRNGDSKVEYYEPRGTLDLANTIPVNLNLQQIRHNYYYQYRSYFTSKDKTSMTLTEETKPYIFKNPEIEENEHPGSMVTLPYGFGPLPPLAKNKKIFYFDIDNCFIIDQLEFMI